jgi:uncharacterized membrane protein YeaQ/YmgE (transglycosylase-associated protein family)
VLHAGNVAYKMKNFQKGLEEVFAGIIGAILISAVLDGFKEDNLIPSGWVFLFSVVGFAGSMGTLFSVWKFGVVFTLGWIFGALLLKDVLSPLDFIVYLVAPITALVIRVIVFIRKS